MKDEVADLPKSVYYVSPAMRHRGEEPNNYNKMPETSSLRAIVAFVLSITAGKIRAAGDRVAALMRALNQDGLGKHLPPLNWKFLGELAKVQENEEIEALCHGLAAKQAPHSP